MNEELENYKKELIKILQDKIDTFPPSVLEQTPEEYTGVAALMYCILLIDPNYKFKKPDIGPMPNMDWILKEGFFSV